MLTSLLVCLVVFFFFQAEDGIRDYKVTGVQTCALPISGLLCAAFAAVVGIWSGLTRRESLLPWVQRAVYGFSACMVASNAVMVGALLNHDFSVKYVAQVGSRATPTLFTIVSLWSALEGS